MDDPRITSQAGDDRPPVNYPDEDVPRRRRYGHPDFRKDREHLDLLSIFYFVLAGLQCIGILGALFYIVLGIFMVSAGSANGPNGPPPGLGFVMIGIGIFAGILGAVWGTCLLQTGRWLRQRTHPTFCFVISCILCLSVPLGTILGIFTILVLNRPSVQELFQYADRPPSEGGHDEEDL